MHKYSKLYNKTVIKITKRNKNTSVFFSYTSNTFVLITIINIFKVPGFFCLLLSSETKFKKNAIHLNYNYNYSGFQQFTYRSKQKNHYSSTFKWRPSIAFP